MNRVIQKLLGISPSDSGARLKKAIDECMETKKREVEACQQTREAAIRARTATLIQVRKK